MSDKKLKWGCIQPLTGGMYIGAANAFGYDASWILTFDGLDSHEEQDGKILHAANEYNLRQWLKKNNREVPYYQMERAMFQNDMDMNPAIKLNGEAATPDYSNMDVVVAVPVCSGLSAATIASQDTKDTRNNNMLWIANYAMKVIKPQVYIFENAPALVSGKGEPVRAMLEDIAAEAGYSVTYYKTDTKYHYNCQHRPRTFVYFVKDAENGAHRYPKLDYIHEQIPIEEYLSTIPENATQKEPFKMSEVNEVLLGYVQHYLGKDWRNEILKTGQCPTTYIVRNNKINEFKDYMYSNFDHISSDKKDKIMAFFNHVKTKLDANMNFYATTIYLYKDATPSVQFKSIKTMLHPKEDRLFSIRECLHLMGMPHDYELYGDPEVDGPKIGQNVPVKTAQFIVEQAIKCLKNEDLYMNVSYNTNTTLYDNTVQNNKKINTNRSLELF